MWCAFINSNLRINIAKEKLNQKNSSSTTATLSAENASSSTAQSILDLQQQIISQSDSIKKYLQKHQNDSNKDTNLALLESLFHLFQSEVSMNLSLRNTILNERKMRIQAEKRNSNNYSLFYEEISNELGMHINSMEQVKDLIKNRQSSSKKFSQDREIIESLKSKLNESRSQIKDLKSRLIDSKSKIAKLDEILSKQKDAIEIMKEENMRFKSRLTNEMQNQQASEERQQQIYSLKAKNEQLEECVSSLQAKVVKLKEQIKYAKMQNRERNCIDDQFNDYPSCNRRNYFQNDEIDKLLAQMQKLQMQIDIYKQMATDYKSENHKLQHQMNLRNRCHWSMKSIRDAFFNIQDILGLDPETSPNDTFSAVSSLICRLHSCM